MVDKDISQKLNERLNPEWVKTNPKKMAYIDGYRVKTNLNSIFGFDGWSYQIVELRQSHDFKSAKGTAGVAYIATVELSIKPLDVTRQDVGGGTGYGNEAHEDAAKQAVTDALKRCAASLGNQFGLALYDKEQTDVGYGQSDESIDEADLMSEVNSLASQLYPTDEAIAKHKDEMLIWLNKKYGTNATGFSGLNKAQLIYWRDAMRQKISNGGNNAESK